jgi:hypothetical protein
MEDGPVFNQIIENPAYVRNRRGQGLENDEERFPDRIDGNLEPHPRSNFTVDMKWKDGKVVTYRVINALSSFFYITDRSLLLFLLLSRSPQRRGAGL